MLSTHAMHKEKSGHDFNPTQSYHGTPNINVLTMALTMNNKYVMESHASVIPKHKTMQQKIKNQCTTYYNARSSYGASSIMKHDGFQFGICKRSFARKAFNHSTKFSHVCRLVITQTIGAHV